MKIVGYTVGTTMPRPDWNQTDPTKADYIRNKPSATDGVDGVTFTPSMDENGNLSWSNNGGLENPETVNLTGPAGADGADGKTPEKGTDYFTEEDKSEMVEDTVEAIPRLVSMACVDDQKANTYTITRSLSDGSTSVLVVNYDQDGEVTGLTVDGNEIPITEEIIENVLYFIQNGAENTADFGEHTLIQGADWNLIANDGDEIDCVQIMASSNSTGTDIESKNLVDLSDYSQMVIDIPRRTAYTTIRLIDKAENNLKTCYQYTDGSSQNDIMVTVDISAIKVACKVRISVRRVTSESDNVVIRNIWFKE